VVSYVHNSDTRIKSILVANHLDISD